MAKGKYQQWLEPEKLLLLESWARDGLTDEQIASNIGIRRETLYQWKARYPNISNALKKGKEVVDIQVENALLKRALGFEYEEERMEITERDGKQIVKHVVRTKRYVAPNVGALIFWLKNRKSDKWKDKPDPVMIGTEDTLSTLYAALESEEGVETDAD